MSKKKLIALLREAQECLDYVALEGWPRAAAVKMIAKIDEALKDEEE
jgi:molybdopterin-guanine dinucleotide biosynthesis protein